MWLEGERRNDAWTCPTRSLLECQTLLRNVISSPRIASVIELKVGDEQIGRFTVESLSLLDRHEFAEPVLIRLARVDDSEGDSK